MSHFRYTYVLHIMSYFSFLPIYETLKTWIDLLYLLYVCIDPGRGQLCIQATVSQVLCAVNENNNNNSISAFRTGGTVCNVSY